MSECHDKQIAKLLHAYELGLLSGEERAQVERHIIECDRCFADLQPNARAARLLKLDPETRRQVRELTRPQMEESVSFGYWAVRRWRMLAPVVVVVTVVLLLVLKDWRFDVRPSEPAVAGENRLAILPFTNLAQPLDSTKLGEIVANLLITGLSQSDSLQVVSSQYAFDLVNQIRTSGTVGAGSLSEAVARRANARWALDGSITQVKPVVVLTAQIIDVSSGTIKSTAQVSLADTQTVFAAIDQLSNKVRNTLLKSSDASQPSGRSVADMTTKSPEAYQEYIQGVDFYRKFYYAEAEKRFLRALQFDSTFAMPYYFLSILAPVPKRQTYVEQALKYASRASERDRYMIDSRVARLAGNWQKNLEILNKFVKRYKDEKEPLYQLAVNEATYGMHSAAVEHLLMALVLDSSNTPAWNQLAYGYDRIGKFESAIQAIDRSIALAPGEPNPYDSRGEIYSRNGRLDEAIESFRQALRIKPDFYASLVSLGSMCAFKGEYDRADSCFGELAKSPSVSDRSTAALYRCYMAGYQGRLHEALAQLEAAMRADSMAGYTLAVPNQLYWKATILEASGNVTEALEVMAKSLAVAPRDLPDDSRKKAYYIGLLARAGRMRDAVNEAARLKMVLDSAKFYVLPHRLAMASIAFTSARPDSAFSFLEDQMSLIDGFYDRTILGKACFEAHLSGKAINVFAKADSSFAAARLFWGAESVKLHYYLGLAWEQKESPEQAANEYRMFLTIWKAADPGIKEIADARSRLQRLGYRP